MVGCAKKIIVEIPPRINLQSYQTIGIVEFSSNSTEQLNQFATQKMMNYIQGAQNQVRFLEIGSQEQLLKKLGHENLDLEAIKAIGQKYHVSSVFTGSYDISEMKPKVSLSEDFSSITASANVHITMASKHWDTQTGATIWTHSRYGEWPVGKVSMNKKNPLSISMSDPEGKYGHFLSKLVYRVTDDFRPHYEKRKASK
jgi:hypothetical protein